MPVPSAIQQSRLLDNDVANSSQRKRRKIEDENHCSALVAETAPSKACSILTSCTSVELSKRLISNVDHQIPHQPSVSGDAPSEGYSIPSIDSSAISCTYQHKALPDPNSYIRLLELDHDDPLLWLRGDIYCKLTIWPIKHAPSYCAISYVWGDPSRNCEISIDGASHLVPRSSYDVLRQLSLLDSSRYYFIDSICINQQCVKEKNGQVAAMGRVYRQAQHVLVCLGWHDDGAEAAMHIINDIEPKLPPSLLADPNSYRGRSGHPSPLMSHTRQSLQRELGEYLEVMLQLLGHRMDVYLQGFDSGCFDNTINRKAWQLIRSVKHGYGSVRGSPRSRLMELTDALAMGRGRLCADRRDAIYSVLSIIDWGLTRREEAKPIEPDFDKPPFQLALELVRIGSAQPVEEQAKTIAQALGINAGDPDLRRAIGRRRRRADASLAAGEEQEILSTAPQLAAGSGIWFGIDLSHGMYRTQEHTLHGRRLYRIAPTADAAHVLAIATGIQASDSILWRTGVSGLVVRPQDGPQDGAFAIVGHAFLREDGRAMTRSLLRGCRHYKVTWDAEDVLVMQCLLHGPSRPPWTGVEPPEEVLVDATRTRICNHPFSSYAELNWYEFGTDWSFLRKSCTGRLQSAEERLAEDVGETDEAVQVKIRINHYHGPFKVMAEDP